MVKVYKECLLLKQFYLIRGEKGTPVTLTIKRLVNEEPIEVKIVRDVIPIETVYDELDEDGIGHIHITSFSQVHMKSYCSS